MIKQRSSQSGFAIGTILLAVILIAAIVSAIAIASRGSSNQSNREGARVQASTLIQQGVNLRNGFERMVTTGTGRDNIVATGAAGRANTAGSADCTTATSLTAPLVCLYSNPDGGTAAQVPPSQAFTPGGDNSVGRYRLHQHATVPNVGTAGQVIVMEISDIRLDVCRQINSLVMGGEVSSSTNPPAPTAAVTLTGAEDAAAGGFDLTGLNTGATFGGSGVNFSEGCFNNTIANAAAPTDAAGVFVYYKVMSEN